MIIGCFGKTSERLLEAHLSEFFLSFPSLPAFQLSDRVLSGFGLGQISAGQLLKGLLMTFICKAPSCICDRLGAGDHYCNWLANKLLVEKTKVY
jgi:hypothetical protein